MEQAIVKINPEEVLTWTQVCYYGAGALVGLVAAYLKIRVIIRRRRKEKYERDRV